MIVKSYGPEGAPMVIVKECTGHTCHPHHFLWYLFHQPTTTVSLKVTCKFDTYKTHVSQGQGWKFNLPGPFANGPPPLASTVINRIALQGSHCYSWRGHNTVVLHPSHSTWGFYPNKILKDYSQNKKWIYELVTSCWVHIKWLHPVE